MLGPREPSCVIQIDFSRIGKKGLGTPLWIENDPVGDDISIYNSNLCVSPPKYMYVPIRIIHVMNGLFSYRVNFDTFS